MSRDQQQQDSPRDPQPALPGAHELRGSNLGARKPKPRARRPISAHSPLEGRQLWRIGDWGGASEQIGRRWEAFGAPALDRLVGAARAGPEGPYLPRRALVLGADPALAAQVHAEGKPHADAILLGEADGRTVLEAVDFKWTLETANPKQVGVEVLAALLADPPPLLATRLAENLADLPESQAPLYQDGIFLAPDHAENRAILAPGAVRTRRAILPTRGEPASLRAVLCPVDAAEFFHQLPGWDVAVALARADGSRVETVEAAERYYRLGAGVLGALRKLRAGVFDEPGDLDGPAELARLRGERRLRTTGELIAYLDRALTARSELLDRLREVERAGYPFGLFREDLVARGLPATGPGAERRWGRLYGGVIKALGVQIRAGGRELLAGGGTEAQALAELDTRRTRWTARARQILDGLLAARQADERRPTSDDGRRATGDGGTPAERGGTAASPLPSG